MIFSEYVKAFLFVIFIIFVLLDMFILPLWGVVYGFFKSDYSIINNVMEERGVAVISLVFFFILYLYKIIKKLFASSK